MNVKRKRIIIVVSLLILSIIYILPMFFINGISHFENQDTYFHLTRIKGLSNVWNSPVNFNNFGKHGNIVNIFYPWLTVYPMYLIYGITNNLVLSYKLYYFFLTFLTMLIAYYSVYKMKKNDTIAFMFSVIYTYATYRSIDIFQRAALGEAVALTFAPLILLGCYMIFFQDYKKWYYLTIGMTLTVYTHLLSVFMTSGIIFIALIISVKFWDQKIIRMKKLLYATLWTLLLSMGFFVPFLQQAIATSIHFPQSGGLQGVKVSDFIIDSLNNDFYSYTLGFFLLIFGSVIFVNLVKERTLSIDKSIFLLGICMAFASTSLFPWKLLSRTPINSIQFVWRITAYSTLLMAYGISIFIKDKLNNKSLIVSVLLLTLLLHTSSSINLFTQHKYTRISSTTINKELSNYKNYDYANKESIAYPEVIDSNKFHLKNKAIDTENTNTDSVFEVSINNNSDQASLISPIYKYLGQKIVVNDKLVNGKLSKFGTTEINVDRGSSNIRIEYEYTTLAKLSMVISSLSLIIFVYLIIFINRNINTIKTRGSS